MYLAIGARASETLTKEGIVFIKDTFPNELSPDKGRGAFDECSESFTALKGHKVITLV